MYDQLIINGIISGSMYALIAIGYTMVYGIGRFINFAHGELFLAGAFVHYTLHSLFALPSVLSLILSVLSVAIMGIIVERIAFKPFRDANQFIPLINTIGISVILQSTYQIIFGADSKTLRVTQYVSEGLHFGDIIITPVQIGIISTSLIAFLLLLLFLNKTRMGTAIRATAEDREIAAVLGINVNAAIAVTFAIGSGLAAIAGILMGYNQDFSPTIGSIVGIKAFTAAVLGGIGSVSGAAIGGLVIGLLETYLAFYISSGYKECFIFLILLLLLFFRPQGLLGKKLSRF